MNKETEGVSLATIIIVKIVCCGGIILLATGAMSGLGAWLMENGVIWLGAGFAVAAGVLLLMRGRRKKNTDRHSNPRHGSSIEHRHRADPARTAR